MELPMSLQYIGTKQSWLKIWWNCAIILNWYIQWFFSWIGCLAMQDALRPQQLIIFVPRCIFNDRPRPHPILTYRVRLNQDKPTCHTTILLKLWDLHSPQLVRHSKRSDSVPRSFLLSHSSIVCKTPPNAAISEDIIELWHGHKVWYVTIAIKCYPNCSPRFWGSKWNLKVETVLQVESPQLVAIFDAWPWGLVKLLFVFMWCIFSEAQYRDTINWAGDSWHSSKIICADEKNAWFI